MENANLRKLLDAFKKMKKDNVLIVLQVRLFLFLDFALIDGQC